MSAIDFTRVADELEKMMKPSSVKTHISQIKRVFRNVVGDNEDNWKSSMLRNSKPIKAFLDTLPATQSKNLAGSIIRLAEIYKIKTDAFENYFTKKAELSMASRCSNTPTDKRKEQVEKIDFEEMAKQLKEETDPTKRLILALYCGKYIPPLRQGEYLNMKVFNTKRFKKPRDVNYVSLKDKTIVINNHKTDVIHGIKMIPIPSTLVDEIRLYMKAVKPVEPVLFENWTNVNFTRFMNRNFGFSTQSLRNAYVSRIAVKMNEEDRRQNAFIMGHTLSCEKIDYEKDM